MSDIAIQVENLGKLYRIGQNQPYLALRDIIANVMSAPARRLRSALVPAKSNSSIAIDSVWALKDVCFEVKHGEVIGVIGSNGAGKSTLLKILSRITEPTEGQAKIRGRVGSLLEVGTGFHSELTGRENVFLNGAILGMKRVEIQRKFDEIVAFAEVEKFIDTPVKWYSSGMYVRLAFAVAAHLEPEILLVDEVLAVGDMDFQKKCIGRMGDIGREGRTVLLVSHNLQMIANLCHRAILLSSGTVARDGSPEDIVQSYMEITSWSGSEVVWPDSGTAPGTDTVRLHSVRILSGDGTRTGQLDVSDDIIILIEYWCLREGAKLNPSMYITNHLRVHVLESSNYFGPSLTKDEWYDRPHPVGLYQVSCRVPANFLNEGIYTITLGMFGVRYQWQDVVSFRVIDSGTMPKPDNHPWVGVVRCRLTWSTNYLGTDSPARAETSDVRPSNANSDRQRIR